MNYNGPRFRSRLTALFTLILTVGMLALPATAGASNHQIQICHATGSETNPYTSQNVRKSQVADPDGHGSFDSGVHPDDIIAPFPAGEQGANSWDAYPGKNWNTAGQAIRDAGCDVSNDVVPAPNFDLTVNPAEVCLGEQVTVAGENTGNVELHVTGVLTLPNSTEMPLEYTLAPGQQLTINDTPVQLGLHEASLNYAYDGEFVANETVTFNVIDCDPPVVTQCPAGYTQVSAEGVSPVLCPRTVIEIQERIVERVVEREVLVEVPVPGLPEELPTGPAGPDEPDAPDATEETESTTGTVLPTELATGFGPAQNDSPMTWYALALMGLTVAGAGVALRRN